MAVCQDIRNPRDIPKVNNLGDENPDTSRHFGISGYPEKMNPYHQNLGIFVIFHSGFHCVFKIHEK